MAQINLVGDQGHRMKLGVDGEHGTISHRCDLHFRDLEIKPVKAIQGPIQTTGLRQIPTHGFPAKINIIRPLVDSSCSTTGGAYSTSCSAMQCIRLRCCDNV